MKSFSISLLIIWFVWNSGFVYAQTLTDKLLAEDPTELVNNAREKGKIVRGAILFHQGNINCAKCHRNTSEKERIGPNLSLLGSDVSDESIVESILLPSKVIKKEYETISALTLDGVVINGMIVREDDKQIIVRDQQNVDLIHTLMRDELDEIQPGKLSSMPDKLADQLKNRQQFLDLLRYVIDIKERGPVSERVELTQKSSKLQSALEGLISINKFNCNGCHEENLAMNSVIAAKKAPRLHWSAKRLNPNFIAAFIADPESKKTGSTMPDLLGHLEPGQKSEVANAIAQFLIHKFGNEFESTPVKSESVGRGYSSFHSVGCVACHAERDKSANEIDLADSSPLGHLYEKYSVDSLLEFLEDPLQVRSSGHMPNMQLTHREASDIAHFLLQQSPETVVEFDVNEEMVDKGRHYFEQYRCASCHVNVLPDVSERLKKEVALSESNLDKGCLSKDSGASPRFNFADGEIANIVAAVKHDFADVDNTQRIEISLRAFNCLACHSRGDLAGVSDKKNPHFTTTNLNLGDQGRIPPSLTGVGAKLKPKWMRDVLVNRRSIRPYMNTRMPQYGEENVGYLVDLFQNTDQLTETVFADFKDQKETRKWGLELAGSNGLNCVACHTYKYKLSDTMPAVDLTEMAARLKKDWFYQYMLDPQSFSPNTVMPSFWPGGNAIRKDIKGMPSDQVEALWQYLIDGRQAPTPRGIVREPLEIVVSSEAKMLRRQYPGIGKRGIGVGYPGGVNIAFDAEQMRLASIWKGKFVDPGGVWRGQGSGNVRPMGKTIDFNKGPDLDFADESWSVDEGRPPNHQFKGYRLDEQQRPTFKYVFNGLTVEDFFVESTTTADGAIGLKRTITIFPGEQDSEARFRIASGNISETDNWFAIDDRLLIQIRSEQKTEIVDTVKESVLQIPVTLGIEQQKIEIEYSLK